MSWASSPHPPAPHNGGFAGESAAGGHCGGSVGSSYASYQRAPPDRAGIDGKLVYMFGTGADRMKKTEGKLVLCAQSGEIKIEVPGYEPLSATEFSALAKHKWKRPRQSIKLAHADQNLEEFEYAMNAVPPGTCRRYPYERDTEEQKRAEVADTARMRQLKKAHERNLRRSMKRKVYDHPNDIGVVGQAELPELRAGTWATAQDAPAAEIGEAEFNRKVDRVHKMWKKNSSLLYDFVMIQMLDCPSLTVQWLPETRAVPGYPDFLEHRLLIGTYSSAMSAYLAPVPERTEKRGRKPAPKPVQRDYLMVAGVQVPRSMSDSRESMDADDKVENNALYAQAQVDVVARYGHSGEVNRARYMPQNPRIVATKSGGAGGELYLFDMQALGNKLLTNKDQHCADHYLTLRGHTKEGYGLCWNERKSGYLLSGSYDNRVCVWDVMAEAGKSRTGAKQLDPLNTFNGHVDAVADVAWSPHQDGVFYSVGDDKKLFIWDLRSARKAASSVISEWAVNTIDCNTFGQHILATGSGCKGSGVVRIWDDRKMHVSLNEFMLHSDVVDVVSWSPHNENVLATGGRDRKVQILDIQKAPPPSRPDTQEVKEVMFVHGGHRHNVSDLSWNPECPWFISSVSDAEENIQFWQPTQAIWANHTHTADVLSESADSDEEAGADSVVAGNSHSHPPMGANGQSGGASCDKQPSRSGAQREGQERAGQESAAMKPALDEAEVEDADMTEEAVRRDGQTERSVGILSAEEASAGKLGLEMLPRGHTQIEGKSIGQGSDEEQYDKSMEVDEAEDAIIDEEATEGAGEAEGSTPAELLAVEEDQNQEAADSTMDIQDAGEAESGAASPENGRGADADHGLSVGQDDEYSDHRETELGDGGQDCGGAEERAEDANAGGMVSPGPDVEDSENRDGELQEDDVDGGETEEQQVKDEQEGIAKVETKTDIAIGVSCDSDDVQCGDDGEDAASREDEVDL